MFNMLLFLIVNFWNIVDASRPNPGLREKIKLNFYFNIIFKNARDVKG